MQKFTSILFFVFLTFSHTHLSAEVSNDKKMLIDKLMEQSGQSAVATGQQFSNVFIQQMTASLKKSNPEINPKAFEIINEEINLIIQEELVEKKQLSQLMYPIYDKHFTSDDLKEMVALYDTPFGQKLLKVMPQVTQESIRVGQTFGQALAPKIQQRILSRFEKEGIK